MQIKAIPTEYGNQMFRSRLEARWAAFFDLAGWEWDYEPIDLKGWAPDFQLHFDDVEIMVEVKPMQLAKHETGAWILPAGAEFDKAFGKAKAHYQEFWVLCLGVRPQTQSDFFGVGSLLDPPTGFQAKRPSWFEVVQSLSVPDERYLWREAGNLVQWLGKKQQNIRTSWSPEPVA